jgi:integrase
VDIRFRGTGRGTDVGVSGVGDLVSAIPVDLAATATTARGHIEQLPSGSFRVHVYAGTDPVTGKPRRLKQTCPDEASAAAALGKLLAQADGDHFPNREATLGQALAKYLEVADLEVSTREAHEGYIRRTIGPVLGEVKIRKLGADSLDSLYTALKKCSRLCRRLPRTRSTIRRESTRVVR